MCARVFLVPSRLQEIELIWGWEGDSGRFALNAQRIGCPHHPGRVPRIPVGIITLMLIYYVCRSSTQTARSKVTAVPAPKCLLRSQSHRLQKCGQITYEERCRVSPGGRRGDAPAVKKISMLSAMEKDASWG